MKKIFILLLIFPMLVNGQTDNRLEKENILLKQRIDSLEKRLDEKFYTRVPNADFDSRLQDMVDKQVGNYISGKIALTTTIIGLISFLLGFLAKYFFSESTRKQIDNSVEELSKKVKDDNLDAKNKLDDLLTDQKKFISDTSNLFDERIKDISLRLENFRNVLENQIQQINNTLNKRIVDFEGTSLTRLKQFEDTISKNTSETFSAVQKQETERQNFEKNITESLDLKFTETLSFLWADVIGAMFDRAATKNYEGEDLIVNFEKFLKSNLSISKDLKIQLIDTLMRCYYSSKNEKEKYEKMIELIQDYEKEYDLLPQTYVNAAIAHTNLFEKYGTKELKETALLNCDKAINKEPSYGEPYALKLETFIIDLERTRDKSDQQIIKKDIDDLLFHINSIESPLLKGYFLERLYTDKEVSYLEKYINIINKNYPDELAPLRVDVVNALYENYSIATDREKDLMNNILNEGLDSKSDLNGYWEAESYQKSGIGMNISTSAVTLKLQQSSFYLNLMNIESNGMIYFIPDVNPKAINLVWFEKDDVMKMIRGIFEIQNPEKFTFCIAEEGDERPLDFLSNAQNRYSILVMNKTGNIEV
ncbi:MAG: hypothetical protein ABI390_05305 [Daejeonella sp.]